MKTKIIFDSAKERDEYFKIHCPCEIGIPDTFDCYHKGGFSCQECWEQSALEYEIKSDKPTIQTCESININRIVKVELTGDGRHVYKHRYDSLNAMGAQLNPDFPPIDDNGCLTVPLWELMNVFGSQFIMGNPKQMFKNNMIYISNQKESIEMADKKEATYTDCVYELIKHECKDLDAIYEDYIIDLVGNCGLGALKRAGLLEGCGVLNCRQLYTLVDMQ